MSAMVRIPDGLPIAVNLDQVAALCRRYGIRELALFGSVLLDDFSATSDVDVLYEVTPTSPLRSLFDLANFVADLEELLGRRVDAANKHRLSPALRQEILSTRTVIYAEAG